MMCVVAAQDNLDNDIITRADYDQLKAAMEMMQVSISYYSNFLLSFSLVRWVVCSILHGGPIDLFLFPA